MNNTQQTQQAQQQPQVQFFQQIEEELKINNAQLKRKDMLGANPNTANYLHNH